MLSYHNLPGTIGSLFKRLWTLFIWKRRYIKCNTLLLLNKWKLLFEDSFEGQLGRGSNERASSANIGRISHRHQRANADPPESLHVLGLIYSEIFKYFKMPSSWIVEFVEYWAFSLSFSWVFASSVSCSLESSMLMAESVELSWMLGTAFRSL